MPVKKQHSPNPHAKKVEKFIIEEINGFQPLKNKIKIFPRRLPLYKQTNYPAFVKTSNLILIFNFNIFSIFRIDKTVCVD